MRKLSYRLAATVLMLVILLAAALAQPSKSAQAEVVRESKVDPSVQAALASMGDEQMITVIVTLRSQADLSNIQASGRQERLYQVINTLQNKANATQLHLRALLDRKKSSGEVASYESFWVFNGLAVTAKAPIIEELAARPEIASITANEVDVIEANDAALLTVSSTPELNLSVVQAPQLWDLGYTGQGIVVANMDSGVDVSHPDLYGRWRGGNNSWFDPYGEHPTTPTDLSGHGTWTMGVMVGGDLGGTNIGMAPDAQWVAVKIFNDAGSAAAYAIHAGFQWLLDPDGDPGTDDAPHVINNSWISSSSACDLQFETDLQALRAAGILPVFAAGNAGPSSGTSRSPGNNPSAFAVGYTTNDDVLYFDSSRGPSSCGEPVSIFPEIVAPGVDIRTSDRFGLYTSAMGTSLAAPHVSGALALLLSAYPDLDAFGQQTALLNGVTDLGVIGPDDDTGYGRLDVLAAYQWVQENGPPTPPPMPTPTQTPTPTPAPSVNLALGKPVSVSSSENNAHDGDKAVDENNDTYWQTRKVRGKNGPASESIEIDLSSLSTIDQIFIYWGSSYATGYVVELSADGNNWTAAHSTSSGDGGVDSITIGGASARYVRMDSTAWSDDSLRNFVREFEIMGSPGSAEPTSTPTATATPTATSTPGPTSTPTPTPSAQGIMHVGDLDGSSRVQGKNWKATVTITVHDGSELPLVNAIVNGTWSGDFSGSASCTTDANGQCSVTTDRIIGQGGSVSFTADSLSLAAYSYQPADNHDQDGDSNGSTISVSKP